LDCFSYFKRQADGLSLGEYLSDLAFPIFIVDHDRRVLAANKTMLDLIGLGEESVLGRRGGEVITCSRARNPGGCGASTHCRSCTVRILVQETLDDGAPRHRVGATLDTETNGPIRFQVSTDLLQPSGVVRVVFEDIAPAPPPMDEAELENAYHRTPTKPKKASFMVRLVVLSLVFLFLLPIVVPIVLLTSAAMRLFGVVRRCRNRKTA